MTEYDASRGPDLALWLSGSERERLEAVAAYHQYLYTPHPEVPNLMAHATIHMIVEDQLASGEPEATGDALARFVAAGLSRHEAVHAIGSALAREIDAMGREKRPFDAVRFGRALAALAPGDWSGTAP